jgi:hypothetical protein
MAKSKKTKIVRVPGTTNNIKKGIRNFLNSKGHFAFLVNNTGIWDEARQAFRMAHTEPGIADVICCFHYTKPMVNGPLLTNFNVGLFMAIEVKNADTKDKLSQAQKDFRDNVAAAGGTFIETPSVESFINWYIANHENNDEPLHPLLGN